MTKLEDVEVKTNWSRTVSVRYRDRDPFLEMSTFGWDDRKIDLAEARLSKDEALKIGKALVESSGKGFVVEGELPEVVKRYGIFDVEGVLDRSTEVTIEDLDEDILALLAIKAEILRRDAEKDELKNRRYKVTESFGMSSYFMLSQSARSMVDKIIEQEDEIVKLKAEGAL